MTIKNTNTLLTNATRVLNPIWNTIKNHLIYYPTPSTLTYSWSAGSLAGIFLVIQIITGLILSMHYVPHTALSFMLVEHTMRDVNSGWFLRYVHANGASFFFLVVYFHIARGLYYFSYLKNWTLWISGLTIFLLMMATAFLGYVLPWGQMSFWGATVITNLFSAIPVIGETITTWLWGGFSVDNPTLNRFFSLHFVLPFAICGIVIIHLIMLHNEGSSNPVRLIDRFIDKVPFFPYFYWKDLAVLLTILAGFTLYVYFFPNNLGHPDNYIEANPMVTPTHIVPEWYFLPFYAILRSIPNKLLGVIAMFVSILILFLLALWKPIIVHNEIWIKNIPVVNSSLSYNFLFGAFVANVIMLGWIGGEPVTNEIVILGQLNTIIYFGSLIVIPFWIIYVPVWKLVLNWGLWLLNYILNKIIFICGIIIITFLIIYAPEMLYPKFLFIYTNIVDWPSHEATSPEHLWINWAEILKPWFSVRWANINWTFILFIFMISLYLTTIKERDRFFERGLLTLGSFVPLVLIFYSMQFNLILFFFGLEISTICTVVLTIAPRYNTKTLQPYMAFNTFTLGGTVLYFFWSILSSIFILIGIYFVIDIFNKETFLHTRSLVFRGDDVESPFVFIDTKYYYTLLILVGLMLKIGTSPFHHMNIDLNDKIPLNMVAYTQTIYKGFLLVITFLIAGFLQEVSDGLLTGWITKLFFTAGFLSTIIGAGAAYGETDIKRFMAYSSTCIIGLVFIIVSTDSVELALLYATLYFFLCLIFFLSLVSIQTTKEHNTFINDFKEITKCSSISAYLKSLVLCYLAGLPPTLYFSVKIGMMYEIFLQDVLNTIAWILLLIQVLVTGVYLHILKIIWWDRKDFFGTFTIGGLALRFYESAMLGICCFWLYVFSVNWDYFFAWMLNAFLLPVTYL